jgi:hypothetical protein
VKNRTRVKCCDIKLGSIFFVSIILIIIGSCSYSEAQERLSINTSLNAVGGTLSDGTHNSSYYLYGGFRYQAQDYYLSLSLPLVFNSSGSFTQLGGMYFPNSNSNGSSIGGSMHGSGSNRSAMNGSPGMADVNAGIGDMSIYGGYDFVKETGSLPGFSVNGSIKFPTAASSLNIGTGKFDFNIALSARKSSGTFLFFMQTGYLFLGNSDEPNIENPVTFSAGIGNNFGSGKHLFLLEYDSYSTIVTGFASPKQLSLGYTYLINPKLSYLMIGSAGLNNSTSDYTISAGFNFDL